MHHGQGEGTVGAGANGDVPVGALSRAMAQRIDGHNLGAVHGADVLLVHVDELVHHGGVNQAPLHEDGLEGLGTELDGEALGGGVGEGHSAGSR